MIGIVSSLGLLVISGLCALLLSRYVKLANYIGGTCSILACIIGLVSLSFLSSTHQFLSLQVDSLSVLFIAIIFTISAISALYGLEYLKHYYGKKNMGSAWLFFNLLIASMITVVASRNAFIFLVAWELMSLSSFFLVIFEGEKEEVAKAGFTYLVITHIGTFFLLVMFLLLSNNYGSLDFEQWKVPITGFLPSAVFLLAIIGFGAKSGLVPLHIWLPQAHPAAPSYVSAVMSGVMIKIGIYGLIRILTFLGTPCLWWGYLVISVGVVTGIFGILFALVQKDLKKLLAYSSIENIGIILISIGLAVVGMSINIPILIFLGFSAGLLHIINHSFFKGLLFLSAGVVLHSTGTQRINLLGGLLKKMPFIGMCFFIGAAAICGLPPLNGFISEFLLYFASFKGILITKTAFIALFIITSLSLICGLAVLCFTKIFGMVFLGEARSESCQKAHDPGVCIKIAIAILTGACISVGLISPLILNIFNKLLKEIKFIPENIECLEISQTTSTLVYVIVISVSLYVIFYLIAILRWSLLKKREINRMPTWDCGYAQPNSRMQYTESSYIQPISNFFRSILNIKKNSLQINDYFPSKVLFKNESSDLFQDFIFRPVFKAMYFFANKFKYFQHGNLQLYILYILIALVILFICKL